ncbi:uncharacterized protein LOC143294907 [Babylonia areolata]|uniref:uncharacterized protein LOC143294907 n=1 Tax=Babylonia areolata TaxID=304850 RepID=UPI003FD2069B
MRPSSSTSTRHRSTGSKSTPARACISTAPKSSATGSTTNTTSTATRLTAAAASGSNNDNSGTATTHSHLVLQTTVLASTAPGHPRKDTPHHHGNDTTTTTTNTTTKNNNNDTDTTLTTPAAWGQLQQQQQQQQQHHPHQPSPSSPPPPPPATPQPLRTKPTTYWAMIFSSDDNIAQPVWSSNEGRPDAPSHAPLPLLVGGSGGGSALVEGPRGGGGGSGKGKYQQGSTRYLLMAVQEGQQHNFSVKALHVGRVTMSVAVLGQQEAALLADNGQLPHNNVIQAVATSHFPVTTVRDPRTADLVFDSSAAAIAILITFGMGCCTDTDSVKRQLKFPVSLIIGFCCQFILMPVLAFGLAMALPIEKDIRFGLLCTACVPGGGLGHIAVVIGDADIPLSLTMNLISVVAMLGTAPLWIFVLGQYFQTDPDAILSPRIIPIYNFEIWLAAIFLAYAAGLLVNRFRPVVADVLLTWIIKPFLLLATILYITVGVYINMYVFELINHYAVLGAILLPLIGCLLGCSLAVVCRQRAAFVKTIALETSSLNCLIVLAALRFSLQQPDAALASMIPIWVMFTIPGLYLALAILQRIYSKLYGYWTNWRLNSSNSGAGSKDSPTHSKDYDVASAIVTRPGIAALSAPLVVADGVDDDPGHSEKVTVL